MLIEKQKVLEEAVNILNKADQPWQASVEGDSIVARWKWMDAVFFALNEVNNETKEYKFTVTLKDNGRWHENDTTEQKSVGVGFNGRGSLTFGGSKQMFSGKKIQKSIVIGLGKNKQTGEAGIIKFKFDTSIVKEPIRAYLTSCGWRKEGLFG
jgi:hypothetical protein